MKKYIIPAILILSMSVSGQKVMNQTIGKLTEYQKIPHGVLFTATNAQVQVIAYSSDVIRVRMTTGKEFLPDFSYAVIQGPDADLEVNDQGSDIRLVTKDLTILVSKIPLRIKFLSITDDVICDDDSTFGMSWMGSEISTFKKLHADERFIGLGEKTGNLDRRGSAYENWNSDVPAYALDKDPLYSTIPFYMAMHSRKITYGIFVDNSYKSMFNFGASTDGKFSSFTVTNGEMNYYFFGAQSIAGIITDYTELTGRAKLPPYWSLGYQQCRWSYYPESEVMSIARNYREKQIPLDVIYLDINYMDNYKVFTFHPTHFPDPKRMVDELNKMGIHLVTIIDPGLKVEKGYFAYDEGLQKKYFVTYPGGEPYVGEVWPGRSHFPDFTNPEVRGWWGSMFSNYTKYGVEGFWNDMNEPAAWGQRIPDMLEFNFDGHNTTMKEAHNVFGMQMSRSTYEGARKNMNGKRPLVITRATYAGGQRYSTIWTGDNFASEEHMLLGVRLVNSLGICGFPFAGPDIGGFIGVPTRELITRWLSVGVYTPFMRNHSDYGNMYREPWVFGKDWEALQRSLIEQRYRLLPYIYSTFHQAVSTGIPVSRTLAISQTFDDMIYKTEFQNEYMFGDNILVCPVPGTDHLSNLYLPEGSWYRLSTDSMYSGKKVLLTESPLNDLPVFVKAGAVIPMQKATQSTQENPDETLIIHFYKGEQGSIFDYYEDDGSSYDFENGAWLKRKIMYDAAGRTMTIGEKEGTYTSKYKKVKFVMHGFEHLHRLAVNKEPAGAVKEGNTITITQTLTDQKLVLKWAE